MRHYCEQTPTCEANPYAPYRPLHRNHPSACAHRRRARRLLKPNAAARRTAGRACSCAYHRSRAYYRARARSANNSASTNRRSRRPNRCARADGRSRNAHYRACAYYRAGPCHSARRIRRDCVHA